MKRIVCLSCCIVILLSLVGCIKLPYPDYIGPGRGNEVWIAKEVKMYFCWNEEDIVSLGRAIAEDGTEIEITEGCRSNNVLEIIRYPYTSKTYSESLLLKGDLCITDKDNQIKMTIRSSFIETNKVCPGYEEITWIICDESEVEWVDGWPVPIEE